MFSTPTPTRSWRLLVASIAFAAGAAIALPASGQSKVNMADHAKKLAESLAKACPVAKPGDVAAFDACRNNIGKGTDGATMNGVVVMWGGEQPTLGWDKKKLSYFKGEFFQRTYFSMMMFSGKHKVVGAGPEGTTIVAVEAYFRNALPPGAYPYPFWHSGPKWLAYEASNEVRFYLTADGKAKFMTRADTGSYDNRGPYAAVIQPAFAGEWLWTDKDGKEQPYVTLFADLYSMDNPHIAKVDQAYKAVALAMRGADCMACHAPDGHRLMNRLTMLMTPQHAATEIDGVLKTVRDNKMPQTEKGDPKPIDAKLKNELLITGEAFKKALDEASAWQKQNPKKN